jgi:hypothetical protein
VRFRVDTADSSVSASILGLARKKAIYRKGLGATLLNGLTEAELRRQPVSLPAPPGFSSDTVDWPMGDRVAGTPLPGLGRARLDSAVAEAFNDPAAAWQQDPRKAISWQQLMQMTSGLRFHWFPAGPSDLTNMLFKEKDMAAFAAGLPLQAPPGTRFLYSDGNANILSRLIRDQLGDSAYYRFPYEEIFYKTGMLRPMGNASSRRAGCAGPRVLRASVIMRMATGNMGPCGGSMPAGKGIPTGGGSTGYRRRSIPARDLMVNMLS